MALRAYYDGSGKANDPGCRKVTLAGYLASEEQWPPFESAWEAALNRHRCPKSDRGNPYFHGREVFHQRGGYESWDREMVQRLLTDLYGVLGEQGRANLRGFSCTVDKADYDKSRLTIPPLRRIESMCLDHCIGTSFGHPALGTDGMEIYFDRKEEFEPILRKAWQRVEQGHRTWWAENVTHIGPVDDMRYSYPLQAADLLAWTANRYYTHGCEDPFGRNFFVLHLLNAQYHLHYDEREILASFHPDGSTNKDHVRST